MTPDLCRKNAALLCTICVFFLFCEDPLFGSAVFHFTTGFSSVKGKQLRCTQILVDFCPDKMCIRDRATVELIRLGLAEIKKQQESS